MTWTVGGNGKTGTVGGNVGARTVGINEDYTRGRYESRYQGKKETTYLCHKKSIIRSQEKDKDRMRIDTAYHKKNRKEQGYAIEIFIKRR